MELVLFCLQVLSLTCFVVAIHSVSLLVLTLKIQISLVAGDIYVQFEKRRRKSSGPLDFWAVLRQTFNNQTFHEENSFENTHTQQIFLQSLQYFMKQVNSLYYS